MSASSSVNITELIDECPLGPLQIRIIVLCGLVALVEGFDLAVMSVAAPAMAGPLHIVPNQFGAVFSAAVLGLMLGGFGLGPIADRYGRRWVLIGATATVGVFTLCTASATTLQQILLFRFLAGVGLGGAMPSFISLAAEYTPRSNDGDSAHNFPSSFDFAHTGFSLDPTFYQKFFFRFRGNTFGFGQRSQRYTKGPL
jgi:MFS transporter, AAHS family, 4-hydroxybenzoate transporter